MENKKLQAVLQKMNKRFGEGVVATGAEKKEELKIKYLKTPSNDLNEALYGGFARGKVVELLGEHSSGKTSILMETIAKAQKEDKNFNVAWFETEESFDSEYAQGFGVDLSRLVYIDQREVNAETALDILLGLVSSNEFRMICVNSLAGLVPTAEAEAEFKDSQMALVARLMSKALRQFVGVCAKNDTTLIIVNQLRESFSMYSQPDSSGGKALKYYASQRVRFNKVKVDKADPILNEEGIKVNCFVLKNRAASGNSPYTKCSYFARYGKGIYNLGTMSTLLIKYNILQSSAAWLSVIDKDTGEVEEFKGIKCKWNGRKCFVEAMEQNEELCKELERRLYAEIGKTADEVDKTTMEILSKDDENA